ncbi:hypothetical protein [cf. Phormidesmis sp. LEGE 11477]|uniref:hypothetical protein n=1 Tax=cf. Phormidesmis sp. LEGE 11477 TaxID=1828680 RepID=UPI0019E742BC|nr:hypothetical protein [cf. Phormidesmis sp. LEGE 11477]MBE9064948.1 hypothetical protein [cf. Phormidesmis sp. LEGE 11477]
MLYVVPVGKPAVMFNGHRIYSYAQVVEAFPDWELDEFGLISFRDLGGMIYDATPKMVDLESFGCGCFLFKKTGGENVLP